jgi:hypothetical protein
MTFTLNETLLLFGTCKAVPLFVGTCLDLHRGLGAYGLNACPCLEYVVDHHGRSRRHCERGRVEPMQLAVMCLRARRVSGQAGMPAGWSAWR